MARTNYTSLGLNTIGKNDADIEAAVFRHSPITTAQRDAILDPANGMKIYNSDSNKIERFAAGGWAFCSVATLVNGFNFFVTQVITDQSVLITSTNSTAGIGTVRASNAGMTITSETVTAEMTIDEPSDLQDLNQFYDILLDDSNETSGGAILRFRPVTNSGDGQLLDGSDSTQLVTGMTVTFPYTIRLGVNSSGSFYADSEGNSGTLTTVGDITAQTMYWFTKGSPRAPSGSVNLTINAGGSAPIVAIPSGHQSWCSI